MAKQMRSINLFRIIKLKLEQNTNYGKLDLDSSIAETRNTRIRLIR